MTSGLQSGLLWKSGLTWCEMSSENNGEHGVEHQAIDTVILTYNRATDHLDIGGKANSYHLMLDMRGRARRAIEFMVRKDQALQIHAAARQAADDAALAAAIRKGR